MGWRLRIFFAVFAAVFACLMFINEEEHVDCASVDWSTLISNISTKMPLECFFKSDYHDAKAAFRAAVQRAGGELTSKLIGTEDLAIDFAFFTPLNFDRDRKIQKILLHMSGTHGVEAFAGSAIQLAALEYLHQNPLKEDDAVVLFVHPVNPFGFAHLRRVNENNVDLNRNFLTEQGWKEALSRPPDLAGYQTLNEFLNPSHPTTRSVVVNDFLFWMHSIAPLLRNGILKIKRALVSGNYHDSLGIGYGGREKQPSVAILENFFAEKGISQAESAIMIDVHTGLGPSGVDTLMVNDLTTAKIYEGSEEKPIIEHFREAGTGDDAAQGYDLAIGSTNDLCDSLFPNSKFKACVTEEFGTIASIFVGQASVQEMSVWRYLKRLKESEQSSMEELEFAVALMDTYAHRKLAAFYPNKVQWKKSIVKRGMARFVESLAALRK